MYTSKVLSLEKFSFFKIYRKVGTFFINFLSFSFPHIVVSFVL